MTISGIELRRGVHHETGATTPSCLTLVRLGIGTYLEPVVYMRSDCHVCQSEGFEAQSRVKISLRGKDVLATLNTIETDLLQLNQASLSEVAWSSLNAKEGDVIEVSHPDPIRSESFVRAKVYGEHLSNDALQAIIGDVVSGLYSDLQLAAFVTACAGPRLDLDETIGLTRAMTSVGETIKWPYSIVVDKHCVGGLPGNRTTMLVVPIVAALGLTIPKTSSRAITSPAGTADTMETVAPVNLDLATMRRVVEREGGCIVWGGTVRLSPADDILIRVERPLDFDSEGQLVASVLSKKLAAGSTHIVLDIPVGPTAKVRSKGAARLLAGRLTSVAAAFGLNVAIVETDGTEPVGRGIGPALEARDVLMVLQQYPNAPQDLRERALLLAGHVIELAGHVPPGRGRATAAQILDSGKAWTKFQAICDAQGGMRVPPAAEHHRPVTAAMAGRVAVIDNRRLAKAAKLAGAPRLPAAGIDLHVHVGDRVEIGQPLFTLESESPGALEYALHYVAGQRNIIEIQEAE